jgi:putative flippase GtrA
MTPPDGLLDHEAQAPAGNRAPAVDIVIPVRDEERDLDRSIRRLLDHLRTGFPFTARVTIADNGSTDRTWAIAAALEREFAGVRAVRLDEPGRGRALRALWAASDAAVLAYMDVDLSTDLNALLPLVAPLLSGHSDLAIGTRLARGARVIRGPRREVISRCYNAALHATLGARFSDAQCGFKAIRADQARRLLPLTRDTAWFFDTELLVLAQRAGLRIHEVPVDWVDDSDSRVDILATALADLRGIARMAWGLARGTIQVPQLRSASPAGARDATAPDAAPRAGQAASDLPRQILRFAAVGVTCTLAYLLIYVGLRGVMNAQLANAVSLLVTAVGNTALNRRFTFGIRGRGHSARHQARGLIAFATGLLLTSAALFALHAISARPPRTAELLVLLIANLAATAVRFVLYQRWVFRRNAPPVAVQPAADRADSRPVPSPLLQPEGTDS